MPLLYSFLNVSSLCKVFNLLLFCLTNVLIIRTLSYPLFAFTPVTSGGLGLSEAMIGIHMALRAITNIVIMMLYPSVERRLGTVKLYQLSMWLWPVTVLGFPILNAVARSQWIERNGWVMWVLLLVFWVVWSLACFIWCMYARYRKECGGLSISHCSWYGDHGKQCRTFGGGTCSDECESGPIRYRCHFVCSQQRL